MLSLLSILAISKDLTLENQYYKYVWQIDDNNHLSPKQITNKRTNQELTITPQAGSEEFVIAYSSGKPLPEPIDKSKWTATANSEQSSTDKEGPVKNLLDNNIHTIWHTYYGGSEGHDDRKDKQHDPFQFTINTQSPVSFKAITYTPRQDGPNGIIKDFQLFVASTQDELNTKIEANNSDFSGRFVRNYEGKCLLNLTKELTGQFIAVVTHGDGQYASGAEFDLHKEVFPTLGETVNASLFEVEEPKIEGDKITINYKPFKYNGVTWTVKEFITSNKEKHYFHKNFHVKSSDDNVKIDYIDLLHLVISDEDKKLSWSSPFKEGTFLSLGQPIYINSFFAGSKFPVTFNKIDESNLAMVRYYTGKTFGMFDKNDEGFYVTWDGAFGAARDSRLAVVRNDLFAYIADIARAAPFRKQYNSWYDWMLKIDEDNIMTSFKEIEKGCSQFGIAPLDSYVVDDGWNNYNSEKYKVWQPDISGTTYNQGGFWEFNNKFPNKFYPPSDYSRKIGSNFGVWLGPRGGYVTAGQFGKMIEDAGKGYYNKNGDDIDVGSHKYIKNLRDLLVGFIKDYKVNYYKLDGFAWSPCTDPTHDHMVGGPDNVYYFTDEYEHYIAAYKDMIAAAESVGIDNFWISSTTWTSPSPWHLQWSSSVWIQVSGDEGETAVGGLTNKCDMCLTYRDTCYWDFYDNLEFQFPAKNLYNHDPIYGQAGTSLKGSMDDDYFRTFLSGCVMRGTAFFELYYTYGMLDEGDKWWVSGDVLAWAEKNHEILQHSQRFGGRPEDGKVYGYSAWNEWDGIVGIRNPSGQTQKFEITLDRNIGVTEGIECTYRSTRLAHKTTATEENKNGVPYKYGDVLSVTLNSGEYRIYEFRKVLDNEGPKVEAYRAIKDTEVNVRFNKYIDISNAKFSIDGNQITEYRLRGDLRTITFTVPTMKNASTHTFTFENVLSIFGKPMENNKLSVQFFQYGRIAARNEINKPQSPVKILSNEFNVDSFTIKINMEKLNGLKNADVLKSKDGQLIAKLVNGHMQFTLGTITVTSSDEITDDTKVTTLVRERNGMIKIYTGAEISASGYDKQHVLPITVSLKDIEVCASNIQYKYVEIYNYAFNYKEVSVEFTLGNENIERTLMVQNGKLKTAKIVNHRAGTEFIPAEGSQEFIITTPGFTDNSRVYPIDRKDWKITANSEQSNVPSAEGAAVNLIDGDVRTIWHSRYSNSGTGGHDDRAKKTDPFQITIDLGKVQDVGAFSYQPRQDSPNGNLKDYEFYAAETKEQLDQLVAARKDYLAKGTMKYFGTYPIYVNLTKVVKVQYCALLALVKNEYDLGSGAELNLFPKNVPPYYIELNCTTFDVMDYSSENTADSQKIRVTFKPYTFMNRQLNISVVYELKNGKHYIEKQIFITVPHDCDMIVDHIDLEYFALSDDDMKKSWTHPVRAQDQDSGLSPFVINLGQPVYINTLFTGARFPLNDNAIEDQVARLRYHTGKMFKQMDLVDNTYTCWKSVIGAARSDRLEVIRNDFFSYINDISVVTKFRKQYNSWYDWMLKINESNILESFKEIERGCTQQGVPPLDSYVVDDGWNNYNTEKYHVHNEDISGKTDNQGGFWEFNTKFPEGIKKPSEFARSIGSGFGVWLGPRGGYVTPGQFGKVIQDAGKGYYNAQSDDVDVGSHKYINNLKEFWINWTNYYKINYFKLDGFASAPCTDSTHDHMVGGPSGAYYFTDLWERYEKVFEELRKTAADNEIIDFWISITCFVNPSPFHLQWANSVWFQLSGDVGYINIGGNTNLADQMLTYRDSCYYNFSDYFAFQFPQRCLYNHDPIYGKAGTQLEGKLDDDYFRLFLYFCGMRGNAFFEMYYTWTMLEEGQKWYVNGEVLRYIEGRYNILQHSQRFGLDPKDGEVYGYSAWNYDEETKKVAGTIAIRNPSGEVKTYTIKLNRDIGVPEELKSVYTRLVLAHKTQEKVEENKEYHYDDEIKFTLQPGEGRIIDFEPEMDKSAPVVESIKFLNQSEIIVRFNKRIVLNKDNFAISRKTVANVSLKADLRTVVITSEELFHNGTTYTVKLDGVSDTVGNKLTKEIEIIYMADNKIISLPSETVADKEVTLSTSKFELDSFSIKLNIKSLGNSNYEGMIIEDSANKVSIAIENKKIKFTVGSVSVLSADQIIDGDNVTVVRERNTMLKIYINGIISNSAYAKDEKPLVTLENIKLAASGVTFNSIDTVNDGLSYKQSNIDIPDDYQDVPDDDNTPTKNLVFIFCIAFLSLATVAYFIILICFCIKRKKDGTESINTVPLISTT